ncbi:MAG: forkhead box transcription factor, partial [Duncaniella sp.]|nr:forkhead box transcription factor [Duncaniella sp.]
MKSRYKKVYIVLPQGATGGVELGHQLVDYINSHGGDAYVVYQDDDQIVRNAAVTPAYADYNIKVTSEIEDSPENMLVLPEVYFDWMYRYPAIKLGFW